MLRNAGQGCLFKQVTLGENVFVPSFDAPLIRLRHLLPPQKARGEKALDWKESQKCEKWGQSRRRRTPASVKTQHRLGSMYTRPPTSNFHTPPPTPNSPPTRYTPPPCLFR